MMLFIHVFSSSFTRTIILVHSLNARLHDMETQFLPVLSLSSVVPREALFFLPSAGI